MNDLLPFQYQGKTVRAAMVGGEPQFIASDVCAALSIDNPSLAVNGRTRINKDGQEYQSGGLDEDEKGIATVNTPGGEQRLLTVTESGLYRLIMISHSPDAKPFQRFVTHDVLPSIRKTDKYESPTTNTNRDEMLAIRRMNAESKHLAERRKQGESLMGVIDRFTGDLSKEARLSLIAKSTELIAGEPVIALPTAEQHFLTCEQIAKQIGLYSLSDKPHKQAIAALLQQLEIEDEERMTVVESTGPWQGTTVKYAETILVRLQHYIDELKKPDKLILDRVYQVRWG